MKNTLIVNLYGGPGSGKSSGAAYIFSKLKMAGIDAEYVTEFAKDKVWENNKEAFKCQFYISGKQAFRISRCYGKVDVIITDSPIRLGKIYADLIGRPQLGLACLEEANQYPAGSTLEIFLNRVKPYNTNGRNQTEEEAKEIDKTLRDLLDQECKAHHNDVLEYDGDQEGYERIYLFIKDMIQMRKYMLEEKMAHQLKATMSEQEKLGNLKVKVLDLVFCETSNDPELVARADVEVTNDGSVITINGLDLRHNDSTGIYSIVEPELPSGVCINGFTCRAITSAVAARYEQIKNSDGILEKLDTVTSIDWKEYDEFLKVIYEHFDRDDMDIADCLEECKLQLKAANAYINYLENATLPVTTDKDRVKQAFTKMFETSIKSAVNDSLAKIETACVTALDKFCQQMDASAYDEP